MTNQASENLFSRIAAGITNPLSPLVYCPDNSIISYADMLERSARYANVLVELGLKPGDRLAVQVEKSIDALFLYLGCIRAGGVYLPLNTGYPDREGDYFISDAKPVIFVCTSERRSTLEEIAGNNGVARLETLDDDAGSLAQKADTAETSFEDICSSGDNIYGN